MTDLSDLLDHRYGPGTTTRSIMLKLANSHPELVRILAWRTHRRYTEQLVEDDLIKALLDVAFAAPSKSDFQQATVIRIDDPEKRREIASLIPAMPWLGTAPVFLIFCGDARRLERICSLRSKPKPNRNLEAFFNASVDAALVLQTFILAANSVGLGCCPVSAIRNYLDAVRQILSLPEGVVPIAGLTVGYPSSEASISMRLPSTVTRGVNRYNDSDLLEELVAYDQRREQQRPTRREKQRDATRYGYADTYGWSEDKARQANEGEGAEFGAMVRRAGFTLE